MKIEFDDGYAFGKGAFETIKVVNKKPLFLSEHLSRLKLSLNFFEIDTPIDTDKIIAYIENHSENNFALKIIVSNKNFILTSRPDNYTNNLKRYKIKISDVKKSSTSKLIYHKSLCYYENIMEHKTAEKEGYDTVAFINENNQLTETAFANLFFVKDKKIFTPKVQCGLLKGTMRDYIIKTYPATETIINVAELKNYDECFMSNSLMGVRSVASINKVEYKNTKTCDKILEGLKAFGF